MHTLKHVIVISITNDANLYVEYTLHNDNLFEILDAKMYTDDNCFRIVHYPEKLHNLIERHIKAKHGY